MNPELSRQLSELSALYDGELDAHEVRPIVHAAVGDDTLRAEWQAYALIGEHLRGDRIDLSDITARVMEKVREEPYVLAPRNLHTAKKTPRNSPFLALAASVAGVAVVGWLALAGNSQPSGLSGRLAAVSPAPTILATSASATVAAPASVAQARMIENPASIEVRPVAGDLSEYLLAHQTQSSSFRLGDASQQIRTVSMVGRAERP